MLERAAILCEGGLNTGEHMTFGSLHAHEPAPADGNDVHPAPPAATDTTNLRILERAAIERALHRGPSQQVGTPHRCSA